MQKMIASKTPEQIKEEILEAIYNCLAGVELAPEEWLVWYRIREVIKRFPNPQPQHVTPEEAKAIRSLKEFQDTYTMRDLAFIFQRSTETISRVLNRKEK